MGVTDVSSITDNDDKSISSRVGSKEHDDVVPGEWQGLLLVVETMDVSSITSFIIDPISILVLWVSSTIARIRLISLS